MKVHELIAALGQFDPMTEVHFAHSAKDYWHNTVADVVTSCDEGFVKWSNYHNTDVVCDDEDDERAQEICLLS
jgi:hypothetical protein